MVVMPVASSALYPRANGEDHVFNLIFRHREADETPVLITLGLAVFLLACLLGYTIAVVLRKRRPKTILDSPQPTVSGGSQSEDQNASDSFTTGDLNENQKGSFRKISDSLGACVRSFGWIQTKRTRPGTNNPLEHDLSTSTAQTLQPASATPRHRRNIAQTSFATDGLVRCSLLAIPPPAYLIHSRRSSKTLTVSTQSVSKPSTASAFVSYLNSLLGISAANLLPYHGQDVKIAPSNADQPKLAPYTRRIAPTSDSAGKKYAISKPIPHAERPLPGPRMTLESVYFETLAPRSRLFESKSLLERSADSTLVNPSSLSSRLGFAGLASIGSPHPDSVSFAGTNARMTHPRRPEFRISLDLNDSCFFEGWSQMLALSPLRQHESMQEKVGPKRSLYASPDKVGVAL